MKIFSNKASVLLLSFFLFFTILHSVSASDNLKDKIRQEVDNNPFLKKQQIKLKVLDEQNGYITIQMVEGDPELRKAIGKGFDIDTQDAASGCEKCSLISIKVIKKSINYLKRIDGVKEILLTAVYSPSEEASDEYKKAKNELLKNDGNFEKAIEIVKRAAGKGVMQAQFHLATIYENGLIKEKNHVIIAKNPEKAAEWYKKAAEQGDAAAQAHIGYLYYYGKGIKQDYKQAALWLQKAAALGDSQSERLLGISYLNGHGLEQNYAKAAQCLKKAADLNDAVSQRVLGNLYFNGYGVKQNPEEGVKWLRKAAEQGDAIAQSVLGYVYYQGKLLKQDYTQAAQWLQKAAEQGDAPSQRFLAHLYYHGYGIAKNLQKAIQWLRKAAEQGDAVSQCSLGYEYYRGKLLGQDYTQAAQWLQRAAEQGDAPSQRFLGHLYYHGYGVEQNFGQAIKWLQKAVEQGDSPAYNNIAWIYATAWDAHYLNGEQALAYALKAIEKKPDNWRFNITLAASYARNQDFANAIKYSKKTIDMLKNNSQISSSEKKRLLDKANKRIKLYEQDFPYIEEKIQTAANDVKPSTQPIVSVKNIDMPSVFRRLENAGFDPGPYSKSEHTQLSIAVKQFQKVAKLKETGILDDTTWEKMKKLYDPN